MLLNDENIQYRPGKSQVIAMPFVVDSQQVPIDMNVGYFDSGPPIAWLSWNDGVMALEEVK